MNCVTYLRKKPKQSSFWSNPSGLFSLAEIDDNSDNDAVDHGEVEYVLGGSGGGLGNLGERRLVGAHGGPDVATANRRFLFGGDDDDKEPVKHIVSYQGRKGGGYHDYDGSTGYSDKEPVKHIIAYQGKGGGYHDYGGSTGYGYYDDYSYGHGGGRPPIVILKKKNAKEEDSILDFLGDFFGPLNPFSSFGLFALLFSLALLGAGIFLTVIAIQNGRKKRSIGGGGGRGGHLRESRLQDVTSYFHKGKIEEIRCLVCS
jgi:hypothetical protein